jgi:hypothetical protein
MQIRSLVCMRERARARAGTRGNNHVVQEVGRARGRKGERTSLAKFGSGILVEKVHLTPGVCNLFFFQRNPGTLRVRAASRIPIRVQVKRGERELQRRSARERETERGRAIARTRGGSRQYHNMTFDGVPKASTISFVATHERISKTPPMRILPAVQHNVVRTLA